MAVDTAYRGEGGETEIAMLVAAKVKDLYPTLQRPGTGDTGIAVHADAVPIPEVNWKPEFLDLGCDPVVNIQVDCCPG